MVRSQVVRFAFLLSFLALIIFPALNLQARSSITSEQALSMVGTFQTVCGKVAHTKYLSSHRSAPTFINLDRPYPNHIFTALIWGTDRSKFDYQPEVELANKTICVSGTIKIYKGRPEIIVSDPSQITILH